MKSLLGFCVLLKVCGAMKHIFELNVEYCAPDVFTVLPIATECADRICSYLAFLRACTVVEKHNLFFNRSFMAKATCQIVSLSSTACSRYIPLSQNRVYRFSLSFLLRMLK